MAKRRMFSSRVTESTRFLKMPATSQNLYFHLGMHADDDGVVEAYPVMRMVGATEDDLRVIISKQFATLLNEDLIIFLNDWLENNDIRADRKIDSIYKDLLLQVLPDVKIKEAKPRYYERQKICQTNDRQETDKSQPFDCLGKDRLGKDRLGKDRLDKDNINYQLIVDMYNATCVSFPKVAKLSDARKKAIKARLNTYSVEDFQKLFDMAESSRFLKGGNNRDWSANFDWMMKDANFAKILDGNYQDKDSPIRAGGQEKKSRYEDYESPYADVFKGYVPGPDDPFQ